MSQFRIVRPRLLIHPAQTEADAIALRRVHLQHAQPQLLSQPHDVLDALHEALVGQLTDVNQAAPSVLVFELAKGAVPLEAREATVYEELSSRILQGRQ